jgi:hypothetical protein
MRRKIIQHLFIYALGMALLLSLGMRFQSPIIYSTETTAKFTLPPIQLSPLNKPVLPPAIQTEVPKSPITPTEKITVPEPNKELKTEESSTTYEVTAYYLNIRTNPSAKSKIINVVKKGTSLEIVNPTDNGWLKIKGGGYVHGAYAKPVSIHMNQPELIDPVVPIAPAAPADLVDPVESIEDGDPSKPTSAVGTESGLSEADITLIFDGTALAGHGLEETILEVEQQYGINALFTIAVMKLESGNGSSRLAKNKNNLFGLNATSGDKNSRAFSFETKGDSVRKFGQLLSKSYVGKGYTTVDKIATKYCPANSKWSGLVKNIMKKDYGKLNVI